MGIVLKTFKLDRRVDVNSEVEIDYVDYLVVQIMSVEIYAGEATITALLAIK